MVRTRHGCVVLVSLALASLLGRHPASAQPATGGSIRGVVHERADQPLVGATVVASSAALQGDAAAITEGDGVFLLSNLPPGTYSLTIYYGGDRLTRGNVLVRLGKVSAITIDYAPAAGPGEVIEIQGRAPLIDLGSAKTGITIDDDYTSRVPTGRTFTEVAEAAAGAQRDDYGVSFGGATSPENSYVVEGFNVTGVGFGEAALTLPNEFLTETEVITGAYGAEFGRSTGGVLNVVTKSGGNEFHGSVFGYYTPGELGADKRRLPREGSALTFERRPGFTSDVGAELGGPIVRDRLWFHVGFNPSYSVQRVNRVISQLVDEDGDGIADADARGFTRTQELERRTIDLPSQAYYFTSKLSFALNDDHRGSISAFGNPQQNDQLVDDFAVGEDPALTFRRTQGALDAVARWTSDVADDAGQLEIVVGAQRDQDKIRAAEDEGNDPAVRFLYPRNLSEFEDVPDGCMDGSAADPYPMIDNCPVMNYQVGGVDYRSEEERQRLGGRISYRHIVELGGRHELKVGADVEDNRMRSVKLFPGGTRWWDFGFAMAQIRFTPPADEGMPCGADVDGDGVPDGSCAPRDELVTDTRSLNTGAFVQDSWSPWPNLTLNAGLRWERQALGAAEQVRGQIDPFTAAEIEETPLVLSPMLAPRASVIYDWTEEGRSRVFASWGRFYESVPLDLNARGMGGEVLDIQFVDQAACSNPLDPGSFACDPSGTLFGFQQGGNKLIAPGTRGQYSDEVVGGVEYELLEDLTIGGTYIHRSLERAVEDVSPDNGSTFVIGNPGEVDEDALADLRDRASEAQMDGDAAAAARLTYQADLIEGVGAFDRPVRKYDAVELAATKRFSNHTMLRASYTRSRLRGNHPGLYSPDTGQLDPNFTSMYDLADSMANRYGALPHDRPHAIKVDGTYQLDAGQDIGTFVVGARFRGASGRPHNVLGTQLLYGQGETFILGRAEGERATFQSAVDLRLAYGRALAGATTLQIFVDVFNLFDQQPGSRLDEIYTFDPVRPIVGGTEEDLRNLKALGGDGKPSNVPVAVNPNYGNPTESQDPLAVRLGARVTF